MPAAKTMVGMIIDASKLPPRIADQLLDKAEQGDLAAAREADRTDGKAVQSFDYGEVPAAKLTGAQLYVIAAADLPDRDMMPKALPPPKLSQDSRRWAPDRAVQ